MPGRSSRGPTEAEVRALAVAPEAQGRGVGRVLLHAVIDRAAGHGVRHLVLCTQPGMAAARHLYRSAGFIRLPDRDWSPVPGFTLIAYGRVLARGLIRRGRDRFPRDQREPLLGLHRAVGGEPGPAAA